MTDAALDKLGEIREFVKSAAHNYALDEVPISDLILAVDEAVTNTIVHGYKGRGGAIQVHFEFDGAAAIVRLRDEAPGFDPCSYLNMDLKDALEKDTPGGFGLHLIKKSVDELSYRIPEEGGNELTLVKRIA